MNIPDTVRSLDLLDTGAETGGCGCGGCGCGCADTSALKALSGVTDGQVDLVAGGTSTVTVTSRAPLEEPQVRAALHEAGDYQLA